MNGKPREVKMVVLGDTGVGKSSLVLRFVTNHFKPYSECTIGASFMSKLTTVDGQQIKFQIWDTAGQEKYRSLAPMYYRGAGAAIIVYDITNKRSFLTLKSWVDELTQNGPPGVVIAIAGNKKDMEQRREVEISDAQGYADTIGAYFFETSAKDDTNVHDVFVEISKRILEAAPASSSKESLSLASGTESSGGCC